MLDDKGIRNRIRISDPDPGGPKTCGGSYGSGSATTLREQQRKMQLRGTTVPDCVERKRSYSLLAGRPYSTDDLQPRGKALQIAGQEARDGVPIVRPMELGLAQAVQKDEGGGGGGQATGPLQGGQRAQDALQQGRLRVRHALHQSQPGPAADS